MAKNAGRLAGLAALAGAAYLYNKDKDKDKGPKGKEDTGPGYKSTETRLKTPAQSIAEADKSDKSSSISTKGESGTTTPGPDKSVPRLDTEPNKPVKSAPMPAPKPAPVVADTPSTPMASTADRTDQLAGLSRAVKRESKTSKAAQGEFRDTTRNFSYNDGTPAVKAKEMYDTMSEKSGAGTSSARKTDALAVASRAARAADAKRRAAKQSAYKKGGMTSTASSASKRADGIASKGKTKCKMY
jgi:hypothetical protein